MDWRPVQGVPRLSPDDCWDRLQPPRDPTDGLTVQKMDGWMDLRWLESNYTVMKCHKFTVVLQYLLAVFDTKCKLQVNIPPSHADQQ